MADAKIGVTLVGESNPYGADPQFALYPSPEGSAGERLCCLILGMYRKPYLEVFDRVNLCAGRWSTKDARAKAETLTGRLILFGGKVCQGFGVEYLPFCYVSPEMIVLPHPSGRCRTWNNPRAIPKARELVAAFAPEVAEMLGKYDATYANG